MPIAYGIEWSKYLVTTRITLFEAGRRTRHETKLNKNTRIENKKNSFHSDRFYVSINVKWLKWYHLCHSLIANISANLE